MSPISFLQRVVHGGKSGIILSLANLGTIFRSTDATSFHVQSLENLLGISRDLMPHIARVSINWLVAGSVTDRGIRKVVTYLSRLSRSSTQTEDKINIDLRSTDDAQGLINELSTWTSIRNLDLVPTRVTRGNDVYLKTLKECPLSQFFFRLSSC